MYLFRPCQATDVENLWQLIRTAGIGITTLPREHEGLEKKIACSLASFESQIHLLKDEEYFFVLEDLRDQELVGCCAIYAQIGVQHPSYYYKIVAEKLPKIFFDTLDNVSVLHPVSYSYGPSELGALYLNPKLHKAGLGRLLSLSRFLFIAGHRKRFKETLIAEIRGFADEKDESPFWNNLGRFFCDIPFAELLYHVGHNPTIIPDLIPVHPLYVNLLPAAAQAVIGKTHINTVPAMQMLLAEGFTKTNEIDLFDAGPKIGSQVPDIRSIKESRIATVKEITNEAIATPQMLICNNELAFRACYGHIVELGSHEIKLQNDAAKALNVDIGATIRYVESKPKI